MAVVTLAALIAHAKACPKDTEFATSLANGLRKYGALTERQQAAAERMLDRVNNVATISIKTSVIHEIFPGARGLLSWFNAAKANGLKKPHVRLAVDHIPVDFSLAPAGGKNPGCIYTRVNGEYRGKLLSTGAYIGFGGNAPEVEHILTCEAEDLLSLAVQFGHATGNCSFCGLTLTDERSVKMGYGPICARNWGLPVPY